MKAKAVARFAWMTCAVVIALGTGPVLAQSSTQSRDQSRTQPRDSRNQRSDRRAPPFVAHYPPVGRRVTRLPDRHESVRVGRDDYRFYGGVFYRSLRPDVYVVVRAPLGARVHYLPFGYVSFLIGSRRYFYANFTYYLWDPAARDYVVVAPPENADAAVAAASEKGSSELFVYPKEGQSDEQRDRDRYECYLWAVDQTGFDPSAENPDVAKAADYRRALSACLEGRGYTVK